LPSEYFGAAKLVFEIGHLGIGYHERSALEFDFRVHELALILARLEMACLASRELAAYSVLAAWEGATR
jgi:hypothetical protein